MRGRRGTYLCSDDAVLAQELGEEEDGDDEVTELARALVELYTELSIAP